MNFNYLLVGDGRVSSHIQNWFQLAGIQYNVWSRKSADSLDYASKSATHILLLLPDDVIENFYIENHSFFVNAICVHFSGSLSLPKIHACHPLMTFTTYSSDQSRYSLVFYNSIPFACDSDNSFSKLFPMLPNPSFVVRQEDKDLYHAACSIAGNFTVMLWQKAAQIFNKLEIPSTYAQPYMNQIFYNMNRSLDSALTGPLVRGDIHTIKRHIAALRDDDFLSVYTSFYDYYLKQKKREVV